MSHQRLAPVSKRVTIVVGLTVVGFMAFGLALSFYRNALFDQTLADIRERNQLLRARIEKGYSDLEYYQSAHDKDKHAKENLGQVQPGEKVLILTAEPQPMPYESNDDPALREQREAAYLDLLRQMPVLEHWQLYLFHPERIQELQQSL